MTWILGWAPIVINIIFLGQLKVYYLTAHNSINILNENNTILLYPSKILIISDKFATP